MMLARRGKKLLSLLLALAMLLGLLPVSALAAERTSDEQIVTKGGTVWYDADGASHETEPEEWVAKLTKTISGTEMENEFQVGLEVETKNQIEEITTQEPERVDVVLVLDRSGSMKGSRMEATKKAACDFVYSFLEDNQDGKRRIGLVSYSNDASGSKSGFSTNKVALAGEKKEWFGNEYYDGGRINDLRANGGTNIQAGIHMAGQMLEQSDAAYKFIVLLSDGAPTYSMELREHAQKQSVPAGTFETVGGYHQEFVYPVPASFDYSDTDGNGYDTQRDKDEFAYRTVSEAYHWRNQGIEIYGVGVGLGDDDLGKYTMHNVVSSPSDSYYMDVDASANLGEKLSEYFKIISDNIEILTQAWRLKDTMGSEMDFVEFLGGNKGASAEQDVISWNLRNPAAGGEELANGHWKYSLSYKARLDTTRLNQNEQVVGVSQSATLTYTTDDKKDEDGRLILQTARFPALEVKGYLASMSFEKVAEFDQNTKLNATFELAHTQGRWTSGEKTGSTFQIENIPSGHQYQLKEVKAPDGYVSGAPIQIKVEWGQVYYQKDGVWAELPEKLEDHQQR